MTQSEMIKRITRGDPRGLEAMMRQYTAYISTIVWRILRGQMSVEDAEEVVSDVFLAAWRQSNALHAESLNAWLATVARNMAVNRLRSAGKTVSAEENDIACDCDIADRASRAEEACLVRRAVDALPEPDRTIFLRHYFFSYTISEIAADTGINVSTVKTKLRRGREKLKAYLMKEGYQNEP